MKGPFQGTPNESAGASPPSLPERFSGLLLVFILNAFQAGTTKRVESARGKEGGLAPADLGQERALGSVT
jgi:hypothetical protein